MNSKSGYALMFFIMIGVFLVGCRNRENEENIPNSDSGLEQVDPEDLTTNVEPDLETFVKLIGMKDEKVIVMMGEGIEPLTNEKNSIISREYAYTLAENELTAIISYNNSEIVLGIYSFLPDYDTIKWETVLTSELGTPTKIEETTLNKEDGNDTININWMVEGKLVTLFGSNGSLSIQIE